MPKQGEITEIYCSICKEKIQQIYFMAKEVGVGRTKAGWKCTKCNKIIFTSGTANSDTIMKVNFIFQISKKSSDEFEYRDVLVLSKLLNQNEPKPKDIYSHQENVFIVYELDPCDEFKAVVIGAEINENIIEGVISKYNEKSEIEDIFVEDTEIKKRET